MPLEGESLGKSRLDLEANLDEFRRNMKEGQRLAGGMDDRLQALAAVADIAENALSDVKMSSFAAAESERIADRIERSLGRDGRAAMEATQHLQEVKLTATQAAATEAAGSVIDNKLNDITRNAREARRALEALRLSGVMIGTRGGGPNRVRLAGGRNGVGVGPFGSGFGRIGAFGTLVSLGALAAPAAAPGALGLLAGIPTVAAGAAGALGTLILAFQGLGKAIGGDYKAFQKLQPAQQQFVLTVRSMIPALERMKQIAGSTLLPGLTTGLRKAVSPGTVAAVTNAVVGFAHAIGQAGEAWGRYFGSARFQQIFGPLMASAARNFTVLSVAALRLFDALGVVGRAAIPLVNFLSDITLKGAALADSWLRAQDASGGLARGMAAAQTSLTLVGRLFGSLVNASVALGRALYPIANQLLVDLTRGFDALAGWINRNRGAIRDLVGGALKDLVAVIETAATAVGKLAAVIREHFGSAGVRVTFVALGAAIGLAFAPIQTALVLSVLVAGEIIRHWTAVRNFFGTLGVELSNAFDYAWVQIERGAIYAALKIVQAFDFKILGRRIIPGVHSLVQSLQHELDSLHPPNMDWSAAAAQYGRQTGLAWAAGFDQVAAANVARVNAAIDKANAKGGVVLRRGGQYVPPPTKKVAKEPAPGTHAWYMKYLGYDPTVPTKTDTAVFGTPPPFDKNVPAAKKPKAPPLLPALASRALDLASANASKAKELNNTGGTAKRYLENELQDLQTAAKAIRDKYDGAVGKVRAQLFHALTSVMNKIRSVRDLIKNAIKKDRLAQLQFALDLAQLAIDNAKEGSAAYKKAEQQEVKLLRAEIAYLDKRVKNKKLSLALRQEALTAEISAREQLNSLLGQTSDLGNAGANEAQFLSSAQAIIRSYAPNFVESFPQMPTTKPLETKGYETVDQLRRINEKLQRILEREDFPAAGYAKSSAEAAFA